MSAAQDLPSPADADQATGSGVLTDVDRAAPVLVRHETTIAAPVDLVWALQTDIDGWTRWRRGVERAELTGAFAPGSSFHWVGGGLDIVSRIEQVEPHQRVLWGGPAQGIVGIHSWTFESTGEGVRVVTEESWSGPPVEADPARARAMLDEHLVEWLAELKEAAERTDADRDRPNATGTTS